MLGPQECNYKVIVTHLFTCLCTNSSETKF